MMPNRKKSDGEFKDVAHPIDTPTREQVDKVIILSLELTIFLLYIDLLNILYKKWPK